MIREVYRGGAVPLRVDIGSDSFARIPDMLEACGLSRTCRLAVTVGPGRGGLLPIALNKLVEGAELAPVCGPTTRDCQRIVDKLQGRGIEALVGVGGGGTLDVAKLAAARLGLPMIAVATNLAHDGLASPFASLLDGDRRRSFVAAAPAAVVIDIDHVAGSPLRHTRAGVGDVVSNLGAVADWRLAHRVTGEPFDGLAAAIARNAATAVVHHPGGPRAKDFLHNLAEALVLSGIAMSLAGSSRPCSGACHSISHAIDILYPGTGMHGEQVAVGALFAAYLRSDAERAAVDRCFRRHGIPRVPAELGLRADQFVSAVQYGPRTRPDRWTVLNELDLADAAVGKCVEEFLAAVES